MKKKMQILKSKMVAFLSKALISLKFLVKQLDPTKDPTKRLREDVADLRLYSTHLMQIIRAHKEENQKLINDSFKLGAEVDSLRLQNKLLEKTVTEKLSETVPGPGVYLKVYVPHPTPSLGTTLKLTKTVRVSKKLEKQVLELVDKNGRKNGAKKR